MSKIPSNSSESSFTDIAVHPHPSSDNLIKQDRQSNGFLPYRMEQYDNCNGRNLTIEKGSANNHSRAVDMVRIILLVVCVLSSISAMSVMLHLLYKCQDLEKQLNVAKMSYTAELKSATETCVPCEDIAQGPFEEENLELNDLIKKNINGTEICCAGSPEQTSILMNLFVKRKQKEKCAYELLKNGESGCNSSGLPTSPGNSVLSAHLLAGKQTNISGGMHPLKNWLHQNVTTHLDGIQVIKHRLAIPVSGLYYVYSQVGFEIYYDPHATVNSKTQDLYHYVKRYNPIYPNGGNQLLLKSANTQCWEQVKHYGHYTSFLGAALKLNRGDQIYVEVSRLSISNDPNNSYFGLFKIG